MASLLETQQRAGTFYGVFSQSLARGGITQQAVQPDQGVING